MGDQGRLYVNDDVVPAYKKLIHHADLILPNQFEAEYEASHQYDCVMPSNLYYEGSSPESKLTPSHLWPRPSMSSTKPTPFLTL